MNYRDYQATRDVTWRILLDCKVEQLPVHIGDICRALEIDMRLYQSEDDNDGLSFILDGRPVILVKDSISLSRQRFTAAHELGHIILGHVGEYEKCSWAPSLKSPKLEQSANTFAARLLAPACVLWGCNAWTVEDIEKLCGIGHREAQLRAGRMAQLKSRGKFLTLPLEQKLFEQFGPYIETHKLKSPLQEAGLPSP